MPNVNPWYKNASVWLQLASSIPAVLAAVGIAATPVGLGVSAALGLGLAIYNAYSHHAAVTGLAVAVNAADAATKQLNAAAGN